MKHPQMKLFRLLEFPSTIVPFGALFNYWNFIADY